MLENVHFAVNLFTALVFFAVFWLYYDAWQEKREFKVTVKLIGFFLLSLSFVMESIVVESTILTTPIMLGISPAVVALSLRCLGLGTLIWSLLMDPIEKIPIYTTSQSVVPVSGALAVPLLLSPIAAVVVGMLYLRRATVGLEDHLKPLALSFFLLSVSELLKLSTLFQTSTNVSVFTFVAPFGVVWIASLVFLFLSVLVVCRWVFGYLLKQFQAQLFMIYTSTILAVFLITTVSFTGLLLRNMETESIRQIETDVKVLDFALTSQREQLISDAESIAVSQPIRTAIETSDKKSLGNIATEEMIAKKYTSYLIISASGQVLARGEDRDRVGDSMLSDSLVKRALGGESRSTVVSREGVISPDLSIRSSAPIRDASNTLIGVIVVGKGIDTAFVDGMKKTTGLDASVYGENTVAATTFVSPDGVTRMIGAKEDHEFVLKTVLLKGALYAGTIPMRGVDYTAAFVPLRDVDSNPIGMLFVGRPQSAILQAAGASVQYTFIVTAFLLMLSVLPAYYISKYIADQL